MSITFTNDSASISTTEYSILDKTTTGVPIAHTTDGCYQIFLDLSNLALGDQYQFRIYEAYSGASGTARLIEEWTFSGDQSKDGFMSPSFILGEGFDFTMKRLAGSDRTIYWSIRYAA